MSERHHQQEASYHQQQQQQQHHYATIKNSNFKNEHDDDTGDDIDDSGATAITTTIFEKDSHENYNNHNLLHHNHTSSSAVVTGGCWKNRLTKITLKILFSTPGLIALVVLYTIMGAFVFPLLETPATNLKNSPSISKSRDECLKELWIITERLNVLYERNWTLLVDDQLTRFERSIVAATKNGGLIETVGDRFPRWSFTEALLYSLTVITTIGHGNLTPHTAEGKVVTMLYAIIGVPLMLMCLSSLGELFANALQCSYAKLCLNNRNIHKRTIKFPGTIELDNHKEIKYHACNEIGCSQCKYDMISLPQDAISEKHNKCSSMNEHDDSYHLIMDSPNKAGKNTSSPCVQRKHLQENSIRKSIMKQSSTLSSSPHHHHHHPSSNQQLQLNENFNQHQQNVNSSSCNNFHCYPSSPTTMCMGNSSRSMSGGGYGGNNDNNFENNEKNEFGGSGNYKKINYQLESNQNSPSHQHSHNHHHHHNHCRHVQQRQSQNVQQEESMTTATVHGLMGRRKATSHAVDNIHCEHHLETKTATTNFIKNNEDFSYHIDNYNLVKTASPNRKIKINTNNSSSIVGINVGSHIIDEVDEDDDSSIRNGCPHGTPSRIPLIASIKKPNKTTSCAIPSDDDIDRQDDEDQIENGQEIVDDDENDIDRLSDADNPQVPFTVIFLIMFTYLTIGTVIFTIWENWTIVDGAYFCFITLSTIGFGDLVPQKTLFGPDLQIYACCAYLLLGLVLMAMSFSLIETQLVWKLRRLAIKLKMTKD